MWKERSTGLVGRRHINSLQRPSQQNQKGGRIKHVCPLCQIITCKMTQHLRNKKINPDLTEEDILKNNRLATHYSGTVPSKVTPTKERDHALSSSPLTGLETAIQRPPSINSIPASEQKQFQTKPQQVPVERPVAHKDR